MKKKIIFSLFVITPLFFIGASCGNPVKNQNAADTTATQASQKTEAKKSTGSLLALKKQTVGEKADCSLYSTDEISTIWGVPITDTDVDTVVETSDGGNLYACDYNETDSGLGLTFIIEYREFTSVDAAKQDIANVRDGAKLGDTVYFVQDEVPNVGDEAFFSVLASKVNDPKNPNIQLYARKENVVFLLSGVNIDGVKSDYKDKILESFKLHLQ